MTVSSKFLTVISAKVLLSVPLDMKCNEMRIVVCYLTRLAEEIQTVWHLAERLDFWVLLLIG